MGFIYVFNFLLNTKKIKIKLLSHVSKENHLEYHTEAEKTCRNRKINTQLHMQTETHGVSLATEGKSSDLPNQVWGGCEPLSSGQGGTQIRG